MKFYRLLSVVMLAATVFGTSSCKKEEIEGIKYKVFTLKSGDHYSSPREVSLFWDHKMKFKAIFDGSAQYPTQAPATRGVNKLYGFSDCGGSHKEEGARFGWEWYNNQLEISAYTHLDGQFKFELMGAVPLDKASTYRIDTNGDQYTFTIELPDGSTLVKAMKRGCSGDGSATNYKNGPYFGGHETAPHDIKILIKEEKY